MKSICFIVQNYYDVDPRVRRKAEALLAEGYSVDVIALQPTSKKENPYSLNNVQVYGLPIQKQRGSGIRYVIEYLTFFWGAFIKVSRLMAKKHYAVIDINTLPDFLVFAAMLPKLWGAKVLLDMHEVMPEFYMSKFGVPENHWVIRMIKVQEWLSMRFADHVLVINEPIKAILVNRGLKPSKATVILNSANEQLFSNNGHSYPGSGGERGRFVMVYHGTLTKIYGLDIALRGFALVKQQMPGAEFWIIGDGPERLALERIVRETGLSDQVKFLGMMPQEEIVGWLAQSDAGVLATRQDCFLDLSFSNKLPEFIVMDKPVIASRLKTINHYFSESALAYFEPHNIQDLAARMKELYCSVERRRSLAERAQIEYREIKWDVMWKRYSNVINQLQSK